VVGNQINYTQRTSPYDLLETTRKNIKTECGLCVPLGLTGCSGVSYRSGDIVMKVGMQFDSVPGQRAIGVSGHDDCQQSASQKLHGAGPFASSETLSKSG